MPDYHSMYLHLFNEVTKTIAVLKDAQKTTEEMFINSRDAAIDLADAKGEPADE